jgi:predicted amidohydrolase
MLAVETANLSPAEKAARQPQKETFRFWGGSEIVNPYGHQMTQAGFYEEDVIAGEISRDLLRQKRILLPYLRGDDPYFTHRELQRILYGSGSDGPVF